MIANIIEAKNRDQKEDEILYDCLLLEVYCKTEKQIEAKNAVNDLLKSEKSKSEIYIIQTVLEALRDTIGDDLQALKIINEHIKIDDFDILLFNTHFNLLLDLNKITEAKKLLDENKHHLKLKTENKYISNIYEKEKNYTKAIEYLRQSKNPIDSVAINLHESYLLLCSNENEKVKSLLLSDLERFNYAASEMGTQIVNYELARKLTGSKVDNGRLEKVLAIDNSYRTKAAIAALKDHKKEALEAIREAIKQNKTFKYGARDWPVFKDLRNDEIFINLTK